MSKTRKNPDTMGEILNLTQRVNNIYNVVIGKDLYYITPINLTSEKKKFFRLYSKGKRYNPVFSYRKIRFDPRKIRSEIKYLKNYSGHNREIIRNFALMAERYLSLILSIGKSEFTKNSISVFSKPDRKVIEYSRNILKNVKKSDEKEYITAQEIEKILKEKLNKYEWEVQLNNNLTTRIQLDRTNHIMYIKSGSLFSDRDVKKIIVHEIDTHIKRNYNNNKFIKPLFRNCFNYIETEEGLATKNEEINGCLNHMSIRSYAARVLAVDWALENNFYDVFEKIKSLGFSNEHSFLLTSRVKRGLTNTELNGAFTRDHIYMSGKLKIDDFLKKGGNLEQLFLGKIGIKDVIHLKKIVNQNPKIS